MADIQQDVNIDVNVVIGHGADPKDISLLGSGTLQIIELMLALYEDRRDLNLVLLDEPDSHIHRDIQKRLIQKLKATPNAQIFLTTHNESLLRSTSPRHIFHIQDTGDGISAVEYKPIVDAANIRRHTGIQPSFHSNVIRSVGNENSLDLLDLIEARKVVFVEGDDDAKYIRKIFELNTGRDAHDIVFWAFGGIDAFFQKIRHYKTFLDGIGSATPIWNKCVAIFDCDYLTEDQKLALSEGLLNARNILLPSQIWNSYTFESSILADRPALEEFVARAMNANHQAPNRQLIQQAIANRFSGLATTKNHALATDVEYQTSINGQILSRVQKIQNDLNLQGVFRGGQQNLLINFQAYARNLFQQNIIQHVCNKDDVDVLLRDILQDSGYTGFQPGVSDLDILLDYYNAGIRIDSWEAMIQMLR